MAATRSFLVPLVLVAIASQPLSAQTAQTPVQQAGATVTRYCVTCHSERLRTAGLVLNPAGLNDVPADAERWEKVIRKLRTGTMPPNGAPRPEPAAYDTVASYLETELDKVAAAKPNPGKLPLFHRLTGTEYKNAVRDLLALDSLPKEMDYSLLLPQDNSSSGFDNIADLLFISPTAMESYLGAAEKLSRLAIGDPTAPEIVNIYRMPDEQQQQARVEDLPVGTRGGMAVRSTFPLDGEYRVKVSFAGSSKFDEKLEISVDGERLQLANVSKGGVREDYDGGGRGRVPLEFKINVKAGPRLVGVTFIERNEIRDDEVLRPRMRGYGAQLAIDTVTISGPYNAKGAGDTPMRKRIFVCHPATPAEEEPCARRIISALERRAYRRPATAADVQTLMPFFTAGRAEGGFDMGIQRAVQRLLVSPQFLFRIERDPAGAAPGSVHPVSDVELASRLSFFIWGSIPDDQLLDLASQKKLRAPGVLEQQVKRMLADPRSSSLTSNFAEQWLYLRDIEAKKPNEVTFADFDESLRAAFRKETDLFVDSVLRGGGSILDLLSANYTFVNERLARHYGIPEIHGSDFRRVTFPAGSPRGGLLGQGSILTITSYANRTSVVNRGKWVLENLLSSPPPPPPPNVPALKTEANDTGKQLSMRDAMTRHRADPACAVCHSRMDPIGFAMENFDGIGRWRTHDNGNPIDASGVFPGGDKFEGMAGLRATLLKRPELFVTTVAEKLLMYGIGRNVQYFDQPIVRSLVKDSARSHYTFASLVLGVVKSAPFQMREVQPAKDMRAAAK